MVKRKKRLSEEMEEETPKKKKPLNEKIMEGRPVLADQLTLNQEMEMICQLTRAGKDPGQIAEELEIETEKVLMYLNESKVVKARLKELYGDNQLTRLQNLRDSINEMSMRLTLKRIMKAMSSIDEHKWVPNEQLDKWLIRYDPFEGPGALERMTGKEEDKEDDKEVMIEGEKNELDDIGE